MGYTALYRKWRPIVFEDVIGQTHVTKTLMNQIASDNIAHAYLFSGTRGTGKTSTAKIFSRAVNCLEPVDQNPCNKCEICEGVLNERIMDVIEIDAASNNGVDDIRELRENVKYPPSKAKYKVYIIDEVHMLSKGAFNALLKTLEEPPSYVIFILATTEPHKIPATIHSRCQRFEMKRVPYNLIGEHLKKICVHNEVECEDEAIKMIVRNSDGAVRDALSILDQCLSFSEGGLTHELVLDTLGMLSLDQFHDLTEFVITSDTAKTMEIVDDMSKNGKDLQVFIKDYIDYLRNLMLMKVSPNLDTLIDLSKENIDKMVVQTEKVELNSIIRWIQSLSELESEMKWSSQPRVLLEMGLIKLMKSQLDQSVEGLIERVAQLETLIKTGNFKSQQQSSGGVVAKQYTSKPAPKTAANTQRKQVVKNKEAESEVVVNNVTLPPAEGLTLEMILDRWKDILGIIKKKKIATHALLIEGKPVKFSSNTLTVAFEEGFGFHKMAVEKQENKKLIEDVVAHIFNGSIVLNVVEMSEIMDLPGNEESDKMDNDEKVNAFFEDFSDKIEIIE